jgi:transcriptional regulator with XRE-family HTH domain
VSIKDNIKRLREIYGLTQEQLAEIAGVTDKAVWTWENGNSEPRMGAIQRIADHFGLLKSNIIEDGGMEPDFISATSVLLKKDKKYAIKLIGSTEKLSEEEKIMLLAIAEKFSEDWKKSKITDK